MNSGVIMNILKFNDKFDGLIEEPISYWKTVDDIPQNIKNFIIETSDSLPIFDKKNNKYYCPKCIKEINEQNKCTECSRIFKLNDKLKIGNIKEIRHCQNYIYYYAFDVIEDNVLLYLLREDVNYGNHLTYYPYKKSEISIDSIYQVLPTEIININTNKRISYKKIEEIQIKFETTSEEVNGEEFDIYETFELNSYKYQYLYTDNLNDLKNTKLYKYSNIWNLKDYFKKNYFNLSSLTYYPVYYKEFEYLVKMKLYKLAINSCSLLKYKGSFKNTFGVEKEYYSFMKSIDINYMQLESLRLYPTTDINMLNFISDNFYLVELILKYVNFDKVLDYFKEQGLSINNLHEYGDYIKCCEQMKLNLKDNSILFPKYFIEQHDKITNEMVIANDPKTDERIKNLSNVLILNKYEDDKYIIFPADSVNSLINESSQQSNCVRTYCDMVSNNECQIYFMRYKKNIEKSFVTIEVRDGKVVQARTRFNEEPSVEIMNVIKKWEQSLLPIINN